MKTLLTLTLSLVALASCQASLGNGPLDGRVYDVSLTGPDNKAMPDQLIFDGGRFESTACRTYGFRGSSYSAMGDKFEAAAKSSKSGTTAWNGSVHGDAIQGSMKWVDDKGKPSEFRFDGKQANGLLDGKTFEGQICPAGTKSGDKDTLVFEHGGFDSRACRSYGFTITNYTATREGDAVRFAADAMNSNGDTNHWEGVVRGRDVNGTMKHMNSSGKVTDSFDFVATLAP